MSHSALFQEAVANPSIRAYLSYADTDCQTKDSTLSIGSGKPSKEASSHLQSRKPTGYHNSIRAILSRHTDT